VSTQPPPVTDPAEYDRERGDGGYEWLEALSNGWRVVPLWGRDGWNLGDWPLVCVAHYDAEGCYAEAVYVEGDLEVRTAPTRAERDALTDRTAWLYWRLGQSHGPEDLAAEDDAVAPEHRGPCREE
jgi:hypothetical protein